MLKSIEVTKGGRSWLLNKPVIPGWQLGKCGANPGQGAKKATAWPIVKSLRNKGLTDECATMPVCNDGGVRLGKSNENGRTGVTKTWRGVVGWIMWSG